MSVRTEMLWDGKTRGTLANASEMFTKTFPQSAPSLADVNGRAAMAGDGNVGVHMDKYLHVL